AFGDKHLHDEKNKTNQEQAELAVRTAQEDLSIAYSIGEQEAFARGITTSDLPTIVYFPFDSSALDPAAAARLRMAGTYLSRHRDTRVQVVGHTDPIGTATYNQGLGMRRAEAIAYPLLSAGALPTQIETSSAGKDELVATNPKEYRLDRRAVLGWRSAEDS